MTSTDPGYEGADIGEPIPSMYQPKGRNRDNPDLVFNCQLLNYLLYDAMKQLGIYTLEMNSLDVAKNRMNHVDVTETETGGIRAVRQS